MKEREISSNGKNSGLSLDHRLELSYLHSKIYHYCSISNGNTISGYKRAL